MEPSISTSMTYDALFALIGGLLPTIGAIIAIVNWMNARHERLAHRIESVQHQQSITDAELRNQLEIIEYRINANTELIKHRTDRLQEGGKDLHTRITEEVRRLASQIDQQNGYLTKHGFKPRENE